MKKLVLLVTVIPLFCLVALKAGTILTGLVTIPGFFYGASPLLVVVVLAAGMAAASFTLGLITNDYSWVDRLWSTAPVAFAWVYAVRGGMHPSVFVTAILVSLWGLRLTYNFGRRGGYTTIEDYRWPILRDKIGNPLGWMLFNLLFICVYQISLFIFFTLPVYAISLEVNQTLSIPFAIGVAAFLFFLGYESIADQQQWDFQRAKSGITGNADEFGADISRGFRTSGLFRLSRHPNYFGEVMIWWTVYYLATVATGHVVHWSGIGGLLLSALFVGSTWFTESITLSRYPEYLEYQKRTSGIIPWPARRGPDEDARTVESN